MTRCSIAVTSGMPYQLRTSDSFLVAQVLYSLCEEIKVSKTTSLVDDARALTKLDKTESGTERQRLALQFRIAYKNLLHKCMLHHDVQGKTLLSSHQSSSRY